MLMLLKSFTLFFSTVSQSVEREESIPSPHPGKKHFQLSAQWLEPDILLDGVF